MATTTQGLGNIFAQCPDVSPFAATHTQTQKRHIALQLHVQQIQVMNHHVARLALNGFALTGIFVQSLAVLFQGAVHRWHLADRSHEPVQHFHHLAGGTTHFTCFNHFALGIGHRAQSLRRIGEALGLETVVIDLEK